MPAETDIAGSLHEYAANLHLKFSTDIAGDPEDQLKAPIERLLREVGNVFGLAVVAKSESRVAGLGRPDFGVAVGSLLTGHIELKQPGAGANPSRFKGHDGDQWRRFQSLPNLIYTDGGSWTLFRSGARVGKTVSLGRLDENGSTDLTPGRVAALTDLLRDFLYWEPIAPSHPRALAELLAPLCRLLRHEVLDAVTRSESALSSLAADWRQALFPDADDAQFADAYAQTLTYALLLARFDGSQDLHPDRAADVIDQHHGLLAQALRVLGDRQAREDIATGLDILQRVIAAVDVEALGAQGEDPWLYFYEDFLAAYDPKMREERGVYYTPAQVVQAQVRLVAQLLTERLGKRRGYADNGVVFLDPAAGTGTYPLAAIQHGIEMTRKAYGKGAVAARASILARNVHAFEILVGPYAVAHLRVTQAISDAGGELPSDGVHVYLTDTLESPDSAPPGRLPLSLRRLGDEHRRAQAVKRSSHVLVCMGNPPYSRAAFAAHEGSDDVDARRERLLGEFYTRVLGRTIFSHIASLYNEYVYFWRWALWKVFESTEGPGVVSFISASSYLSGPGFMGMREVMRQTFDDLWIIDLEGSDGPRRTENVFAIRTPVAIAIGVRYGTPQPETPAVVHYARLDGTRAAKLERLSTIEKFDDLTWEVCSSGWIDPLLPSTQGNFSKWPLATDIFPWQYPGLMIGRTWPVAPDKGTLLSRWRRLVATPAGALRSALLPDKKHGRNSSTRVTTALPPPASKETIQELSVSSPEPSVVRFGYRSFDRQWILLDPRIIDLPRPAFWAAHSDRQLYLVSLLTGSVGRGPTFTASAYVPDKHFFRGSFGGKDVIPLWRDNAGIEPNVTRGLLTLLSQEYKRAVSPEQLFSYAYGVFANDSYAERFAQQLGTSTPRLPLTRNADLFERVASLGRRLLSLHTFGERLGSKAPDPVAGAATARKGIATSAEGYPETFKWDEITETLHVGDGTFGPVSRAVWDYQVSGLRVLRSWLGYRMKVPAGKRSSDLGSILPERWPADFTEELLELLWMLEATVAMRIDLDVVLDELLAGPLFVANDLPQPSADERKPPGAAEESDGDKVQLPMSII